MTSDGAGEIAKACDARKGCYAASMSESAPSHEKLEPSPFEKMQALATRIMAVPKSEVDRREEKWRKERAEKKRARR